MSDHFPFASPTFPHPPHPPPIPPISSDFFNTLNHSTHPSHPEHDQSSIPNFPSTTTTPAPTPLQTYTPYPQNAGIPPRSARSSLATPLHSPRATTNGHGQEPTPPSTGHSGGAVGTPGAEADSEDKRVRNTLACEFRLSFPYFNVIGS